MIYTVIAQNCVEDFFFRMTHVILSSNNIAFIQSLARAYRRSHLNLDCKQTRTFILSFIFHINDLYRE